MLVRRWSRSKCRENQAYIAVSSPEFRPRSYMKIAKRSFENVTPPPFWVRVCVCGGGWGTWSLTLRKELVRMFENWVLRGIFGRKRGELQEV
jgi:hypothetical protein